MLGKFIPPHQASQGPAKHTPYPKVPSRSKCRKRQVEQQTLGKHPVAYRALSAEPQPRRMGIVCRNKKNRKWETDIKRQRNGRWQQQHTRPNHRNRRPRSEETTFRYVAPRLFREMQQHEPSGMERRYSGNLAFISRLRLDRGSELATRTVECFHFCMSGQEFSLACVPGIDPQVSCEGPGH